MIENNLNLGGVVTYWSVGEWTNLDAFKAGLAAAGFEKLAPESRTPASCLRDSLEVLYAAREQLIRPLKTKDGFAVVQEDRGDDANDYQAVCTARINADTMQITLRPYDSDRAKELAEQFNKHLGLLRPAQVSAALVNILNVLGGVRLRPTGAVYWLPKQALPQWELACKAAEDSGVGKPNCVYVLRHQMDADAVRAVRDAVVEQVTDSARKLHAEVVKGDLGERALLARQQLAEELRAKVLLYEEILGGGLSSLHDTLDTAEQAAAAAVLLASAGGATEPVQEMAHAG